MRGRDAEFAGAGLRIGEVPEVTPGAELQLADLAGQQNLWNQFYRERDSYMRAGKWLVDLLKVRNDSPMPPANINQDTNAAKELADSLQAQDELAQALEKDMNHWLTGVATEYYPDTDRMLFYVGFGGDG